MMAWLLFGASAAAQRRLRRGRGPDAAAARESTMSVVPYLAVVVGYATLFFSAISQRQTESLGGSSSAPSP